MPPGQFDGLTMQVHPGTGVVARMAGGVIVVPRAAAGQLEVIDRLVAMVGGAEPGAGRLLAREVAALLVGLDSQAAPAFAVLAPCDEGLAIIVHGPVEVEVSGSEAHLLTGADAATWVDRVVAGPVDRLAVRAVGASDPTPRMRFDLQRGVVPGTGASLRAGGGPPTVVPAPSRARRAPDVDEAASGTSASDAPAFQSISLVADDDAGGRAPLPIAGAAEAEVEPSAVIVEGISCSRGHFNDPSSAFCAVCGISMLQLTHQLVPGPRPPLGVLVLDDGSTYGLDGGYVLGRTPEVDPRVGTGAMRPIAIEDPGLEVSRAHAEVALRAWSVEVTDLGSANGTFVLVPGSKEWVRLVPRQPWVLTAGSEVELGSRRLVFESHSKAGR